MHIAAVYLLQAGLITKTWKRGKSLYAYLHYMYNTDWIMQQTGLGYTALTYMLRSICFRVIGTVRPQVCPPGLSLSTLNHYTYPFPVFNSSTIWPLETVLIVSLFITIHAYIRRPVSLHNVHVGTFEGNRFPSSYIATLAAPGYPLAARDRNKIH